MEHLVDLVSRARALEITTTVDYSPPGRSGQ
jgi:hypothetical protein